MTMTPKEALDVVGLAIHEDGPFMEPAQLVEAHAVLTAAVEGGAQPIGWVHPLELERGALAMEVATFKANNTVLPVYLHPAPQQPAFRNMKDGATFEEYRDALAVGSLTVVDQLAFDNMLHDLLQQPVVEVGGPAHHQYEKDGEHPNHSCCQKCGVVRNDALTAALQQGAPE